MWSESGDGLVKPFEFIPASSVSDALDALGRLGERARVIGGGQSLLLEIKARTRSPEALVSIWGVESLRGAQYAGEHLVVGPTTTYTELARSSFPKGAHQMIAACAGDIADIPVRNMGTIGGSLCQAGHRFDMPVAVMALGAQLVVQSSRGERTLGVDEFVLGDGKTALEGDELLTEIRVPTNGATAWAFEKYRFRKFDAALASAACMLELDGQGTVQKVRIIVGAAAATPVRAAQAEAIVQGGQISEDSAAEAGRVAMDEVDAIDGSPYAPRQYKQELVRTLVARSLLSARSRAEESR